MKRILIFHISEVSGHRKAAEAIKESLEYLSRETLQITNIDGLRYFHPFAHRIINRMYIGVIRKTPFVWRAIYDKPSVEKVLMPIKKAIHSNKMRSMHQLYEELQPDAIICTQAFPCGIVAEFKKEYSLKVPLIGVVTDFHPHRYWVYDQVDYYTVATPDACATLRSLGVADEKIKMFGIPISLTFSQFNHDKAYIAGKYGFDLGVPSVLIMGGGSGLGPIGKIVQQLDRLSQSFQIIVVCGKNQQVFDTLSDMQSRLRKKMFLFGYVDCINELMSFSDILVTKPGGITIAEALTLQLAVVIINPIPGQEENNTEVLLREGIAVKADRLEQVPSLVARLIDDPGERERLQQQGMKLSKPDAALRVAEIVLHAS